jgi:hypothetical protein
LYRAEKRKRDEVDLYDMVYHNLPKKHFVLRKVKPFGYRNAKRFPLQGPSFCSRQGKVKLHMADTPDELQRLFSSQTDLDALYFRKHIRYFNSHFSFTSLRANLDQRYNTPKGLGVYTFWIHGHVYHRLDQLVHGQEGLRHMHIYFYDTYETIRHRIQRSPNLDEGVIRTVLQLLEDNPYVCVFLSLGNVANLDEYRIEHNTDIGVDQRRYNAPAISQVAAIWEEGSDIVSARKYYCYKLQMRPNEFNIMFYGGRLFQQWLIDMYVMVESMRLDWYSLPKHQKII